MAHLTLAGVSDDGKRLLLVTDQGAEFTLDITTRLRAALRGDASRLGQLEITMESVLRPRDIQARIRAGESAEAVAQAAQTSVEKIMPFAGPVLAERAHVAERAQRCTLRGRTGENAGTSRLLGDAVTAHLRSCNVDPTTVEWDAWRREDGRWSLLAAYSTGSRDGTAEFTYDAPGSYVLLDNDDARWLIGELVTTPTAPAALNDLESARRRRLASQPELADDPADQLPLGVDAIAMVEASVEPTDPPIEAFLDESPAADDPGLREEAADTSADEVSTEEHDEESPARRTVQKKKGRASVPTWDEIMFGGGDQ